MSCVIYVGHERVQTFRIRMARWYEVSECSNLPWRRVSDPWAILVAALLLRKTTVKQVMAVYNEFLARFPSPSSLLQADEATLKSLLRPLGIEHERARLFKKLAQVLTERFSGVVPCDMKELEGLPGVGRYIASEVLLASCGQPEPLLDRNMIRVLERFFGIKSKKKRPHTDPELWEFAKSIAPVDPLEARKFFYGVLDFAREVCTARKPRCSECPLMEACHYFTESRKT